MRKETENRKNSNLNHGINLSSKAQLKKISKANTKINLPQVPIGNLYYRHNKEWVNKGKYCYLCGKSLGDHQEILLKHRYVCEVLNSKEVIEDDCMPIHRITRGGTTYYRYGEHGKEYRTRAEAEKQAAAIKASQAREAQKKK